MIKTWYKLIALLVVVLNYSVYSLTSGPTQPEYAGFTPAKLESMVDLYTGDFTYSIPLLEVPGPSLSYPLTLGYRGGVQLEQEASWVGLGWCLNVGSISRSVNRYPDDYLNGTSTSTLRNTTTIEGWDASIGVSFENFGVGVNIGERSDQGWHFGLDVLSPGNSSNILSWNKRDGWGTVDYNTSDFGMVLNALGATVGSQVASQAMGAAQEALGVNLPSSSLSKGGASAGYGGKSIGFNSSSTHVGAFHSATTSISIGFKIGEYVNVSLGYSSYKYWIHKVENDLLFGYFYSGAPEFQNNSSNLNYKLEYSFAPEMTRRELTGNEDLFDYAEIPVGLKAFAISTPDGFNATGEGISSSFKAYRQDIGDYFGMDRREAGVPEWLTYADSKWWSIFFQSWLDDKRKEYMEILNNACNDNVTNFVDQNGNYSDYYNDKKQISAKGAQPVVQFRQIGDAGGTFLGEGWRPPSETWTNPDRWGTLNYRWRRAGSNYALPYMPRLSTDGKVIYRKANEPYTAIGDRTSFATGIFPVFAGEDKNLKSPYKALTGFVVVRQDGMRYEYTLPVYNFYNKVSTLSRVSPTTDRTYNRLQFGDNASSTTMDRSYATAYLLENIKGPDYVDLNDDNLVSDGDIGGWVSFKYSTHVPVYNYRTPYEGVAPVGVSRDGSIGDNSEFKSYGEASWGEKEIYYLTDIVTPTHTAKFTLTDRNDSREARVEKITGKGRLWLNSGTAKMSDIGCVLEAGDVCKINFSSHLYDPDQELTDHCKNTIPGLPVVCEIASVDEVNVGESYDGNALHKVYTLRVIGPNNFIKNDDECGEELVLESIEITRAVGHGVMKKVDQVDLFKRVNGSTIDSDPLKTIFFDYETNKALQLCPGIPNTLSKDNSGKLTLRQVRFKFNNVTELPPYEFTYYKEGASAPYNPDNWDRWGYYKHDGGLIPVKFERQNIALWSDIVGLIRSTSNARGNLVRQKLVSILSTSDMNDLMSSSQIASLKSQERLKDAIALALDQVKSDLNFYRTYKNDINVLDDVKKVKNSADVYPYSKKLFDALRVSQNTGIDPIMSDDGTLRSSPALADWEKNWVYAYNMALLSEMVFIKLFPAVDPVTEYDRMVMKHLDINRFDHEPNKDDVDAWSLKQVVMPSRGKIRIQYESDDYAFVGRTRAVIPSTKETMSGALADASFFRHIGLEKDLLSKNNILRIGGYQEDNLDIIKQQGTRSLDDNEIRVTSQFRVWRKLSDGTWQINPDFEMLKNSDPLGPQRKMHLIAIFDPSVFSSWLNTTNCQSCGDQYGEESDGTSGKAMLPIPIDLGTIEEPFKLDSPGPNGEYACQWRNVTFKISALSDSTRWEHGKIYGVDADYSGKCIVNYFLGKFNSTCGTDLLFPGNKMSHFQYNLTWGSKIDFDKQTEINENIPTILPGYPLPGDGDGISIGPKYKLEKFGSGKLLLRDAAKSGNVLNICYIDENVAVVNPKEKYRGILSWNYLTEFGYSEYEEPWHNGEPPPPFAKQYWDYYSVINHLKMESPEVAGHVPGIVGGGIRVKQLDYLSGWMEKSGQQKVRTVQYQYVCEAENGKSGNYSSGATSSMPPPYNNQGDDRADVLPQIALVQGEPKVCYGTVHELRPGRGRIVYKFLTSADVSNFFADDSSNYYRIKDNGEFQIVRGAYNADGGLATSKFNPHHRWFLHQCSGVQGLMYRESKFAENGTIVNEKKIKYLTSLTKNEICLIELIGKMNYIESNVSEVLVPYEDALAGAGTSDQKFRIHPLAKDMGVTRERFRMRWLFGSPIHNDREVEHPQNYIGLIEVEAIEHAIHQYSVQTTVDGVGTRSINSYFDFVTGQPIVTTFTEACHTGKEDCGCYAGSTTPPEEERTVPLKTTVNIPAYWNDEYNSDVNSKKMGPVYYDQNYLQYSLGVNSAKDLVLTNVNMLTQNYSESVYSELEPYPVCCETKQTDWIKKLKDEVASGDPNKSALFKRNVTTWKPFDGLWRKDKEIILRANMTRDKKIDALPASIGLPYENSNFYNNSGLYVSTIKNTKYDSWGRPLEQRDAYNNSVANFYNIQNAIGHDGVYASLYLIGQVMNSERNKCAVSAIDDFCKNGSDILMPTGWSSAGSVDLDDVSARSGKYSLKLGVGGSVNVSLPNAQTGDNYNLSFWINGAKGNASVTVNGKLANVEYKAGKSVWQRYSLSFNAGPKPTVYISCSEGFVNVDDIRLAPKTAKVYSLTYSKTGNMSSYCGPEDKIINYVYDDQGRLIEVRDHQGMAISSQAQLMAE